MSCVYFGEHIFHFSLDISQLAISPGTARFQRAARCPGNLPARRVCIATENHWTRNQVPVQRKARWKRAVPGVTLFARP